MPNPIARYGGNAGKFETISGMHISTVEQEAEPDAQSVAIVD